MQQWPNKLGWDVNGAEVWQHETAFRVFTDDKVLRVPYAITLNPQTAALLCQEQGLQREALDEMDYQEAETLYFATLPTQKEMF